MSAPTNKAPASIFDNQDANDLKERQRLEELQRQAKVQKVKLDNKLSRQKIIMGSFLGQVLAINGDEEKMIQDYFAIHFPDFLTRESDKYLFKSMVESLGGDVGLGDEVDPFVANTKGSNQKLNDDSMSVEENNMTNSQPLSFATVTSRGGQDSLLDENSYFSDENNQDYGG